MGDGRKAELRQRIQRIGEQGERARVAGNTDVQLGLREQAWELISELDGRESREALRARGRIGLALIECRRFAEAERLFYDLLAVRVEVLGMEDDETLATRGNLAKAIALNGRPNESLLLLRRLYADRQRLRGDRHESTLATRGMIAHTLMLAGDLRAAVSAYEALLENQIEELGETHPSVAVTSENLTVIRARMLDPESVRDQEDLVGEYVAELGEDDPQTLAQKHLLAETYLKATRHAEGLELIEHVFARRLATLGEFHVGTLTARCLRAQLNAQLGRLDEAHAELLECLGGWEARGTQNESHALGSLAEVICVMLRLREPVEGGSVNPSQVFEKIALQGQYARSISEAIRRLEAAVGSYEPTHPLHQFFADLKAQYPELLVNLDDEREDFPFRNEPYLEDKIFGWVCHRCGGFAPEGRCDCDSPYLLGDFSNY